MKSSLRSPAILLVTIGFILVNTACQPAPGISLPEIPATQQVHLSEPAPSQEATLPPTQASPEVEPSPSAPAPTNSPLDTPQLEARQRLTNGKILAAPSYSADGSLLLVPTAAGVFLHESQSFNLRQIVPGPGYRGFAALSPDNQLLAFEQLAGVGLYHVADGTLIQGFSGPAGSLVSSLAFSPDGQLLAASFDDGTTQVWRVPTGDQVASLPGGQLVFSPDAQWLAVVANEARQVSLYDTTSREQSGVWPGDQALFSPNGALGLLDNGAFRLYDPETGQVQQAFNGFSPSFSPDGKQLALFNMTQVHLYDTATGARLRSMEGEFAEIPQMSFSPDGQTLAAATIVEQCPNCLTTLGPLALWKVSDGSLIQAVEGFNFAPWLVFDPQGNQLAAVEPDRLQFIDPADGTRLTELPGYTGDVLNLAFSPDGEWLGTAGYASDSARLWGVSDGSLAKHLEDPALGTNWFTGNMAFSPTGEILAVGIDLWSLPQGKELRQLEQRLVDTYHLLASSVAFAPTGGSVLFGFLEGRLDLWDLTSQTLVRSLPGYTGEVTSLSYSSDGSQLASVMGYPDYTIQVWVMPQAEPLLTLRGEQFFRAAFSPDGKRLASLATTERFTEYNQKAGSAKVWDPRTGELLTKLAIEDASSLAFSPDGARLATGSYDGSLRLWRAGDGQLLQTVQAHFSPLIGLAFSPDGKTLASGAEDGSTFLWELTGQD